MKRFTLLLCLSVAFSGLFAQKKYVTVISYGNYLILSGDVPSDMDQAYDNTDFNMSSIAPASFWVGNILNLLADRGFEVEQMNTSYYDERIIYNYLLSKNTTDNDPASSIQRVQAGDDGEVREVARYNLQGLPVKKNDKGIQIIVFSNYTTKTVIVE